MKASELRIGNYVKDPYNNTIRLVSVDKDASMIRPIPLTEEWLLKFGFEKSGDHYNKWVDDVRAFILLNDFTLCDIDLKVEIKYVHQLQNLYFALTGKEITNN